MTLLAIVAIHTAANEPPKVRQVVNKIHRNVGADEQGDDAHDDAGGRQHQREHERVEVAPDGLRLRCDEFCSSPDELSEARLRLYG